ncbi:hypothetical protein CTAYLR_007827 [Chrysophaeum taylorii]|uniref:Patatin n=1 Tax=Chrysophaeum taylorii TaxID=2483200 RepID=A0AAD7UBV8_9STRA|nr:hypothetical protein CTAYLR_007827 [Chrysophaeum taylorii]
MPSSSSGSRLLLSLGAVAAAAVVLVSHVGRFEPSSSPPDRDDDDDVEEEESEEEETEELLPPAAPAFGERREKTERPGVTRLWPVDEGEAARWLAATQLGFMLGDDDDDEWRREVARRVAWLGVDRGSSVIERGERADSLLVVVVGAVELYAEEEEESSSSPLQQVGLGIDDSEVAERLEGTLGPFEALGKLSVVVAASAVSQARSSKHRVAAATSGTVVARLKASDLRALSVVRPSALLSYARRCVARLHRVARFANAELVPQSSSSSSFGAEGDVAPFAFFLHRSSAAAAVAAPAAEGLDDHLGAGRRRGGRRLGLRRDPPAVVGGFAFLDDAPPGEDIPNTTTTTTTTSSPGLVSFGDEDFDLGIQNGARREVLAEALMAVVARIEVDVRAFSDAGMARRWLHAGAVLLERGAPTPRHFYVVISGRVQVAATGREFAEWREVGRGGTVGLAGVASGAAAISASARCARDTEVVAVPTRALRHGAAIWLQKLASLPAGTKTRRTVSTVAVLGVDGPGNRAARSVAALLAAGLEQELGGPVCRASREDARLGRGDATYLRRLASSWLAEREERYEVVVLECGEGGFWTRFATSQADAVVVVADAEASTAVRPRATERDAVWRRSDANVLVVLVHDAARVRPGTSRRWLARRHPSRDGSIKLVHVKRRDQADHARLARVVAGRAKGLVLGGGGGRGLAHLGVLRAFHAHNLVPDVVAGCSQGAFMAAAYALPARDDDRLDAVKRAAARLANHLSNPLAVAAELTFVPFLALFDGRGFSRAVRDALATAAPIGDVEDAWLPFFCVATNLTTQSTEVRRAGPLALAVRASMSVAELLPPCRDPATGHLLADGCYVSNLPVVEMKREFSPGLVVGVSVVDSAPTELEDVVPYDPDGVSGAWLLAVKLRDALLRLFFRFPRANVPSVSKVRGVLQYLRNKAQLREALDSRVMDFFLEIHPVSAYSPAASYCRLDAIADLAQAYAAPRISDWKKYNSKPPKHPRISSTSSLPALHASHLDLASSDDTDSTSSSHDPGGDDDDTNHHHHHLLQEVKKKKKKKSSSDLSLVVVDHPVAVMVPPPASSPQVAVSASSLVLGRMNSYLSW